MRIRFVCSLLINGISVCNSTISKMASNVTQESPSATCKKCSKLYTDPRILPCLHSFCKNCIKSLVIQHGSKIRCPSCKTTSHIPNKGVEAIPQNVRLSYEAEVAMYEMKIKKEVPSECGECSRVPPQPIIAFCCTCRTFLCKPCHEHHCISRKLALNHKVLKLEEARKRKINEELKQNIPPAPLHCQEHTDTEVKFYCTTCKTLVCFQCTVIQHGGHKFDELRCYAQTQRDILNHSAQSMPDAITKLGGAIANGKAMTEKVGKRKMAVNDTIQNAFQELRKALDEREKTLLAQSSEIATSKLTSLQLQMEKMATLRDEITSCCKAISEAQRSHTDAQLLSVVVVMQARLQELMEKFSTMTLQPQEDDTVATVVKTATLASEIAIFGSINKHQSRDYKSLSKPVMTISGINTPYYVAVHDSGDIFVPSFNDHCVHVFDKNGRKKAILGGHGSGDGQFNSPLGITISGDVMFVGEHSGHRIQKLTVTGEFLMKFGTMGSGTSQLQHPFGMCLSSNGNLYVTEYTNGRVQVFNPDGTFSYVIKGQGAGTLQHPQAVAFDPIGNLHVADRSLKSIKVFTADGNYIRQYGSGQLGAPTGIVVDQDGYCLVVDYKRKSLIIFDSQGTLFYSVPTLSAWGVTLDKDGFVYAVDYTSNCVYKY